MPTGVRIEKHRLAGKQIKTKIRDIQHPDYEKQVEFIDENGDGLDETWVYGITDERTVEFLKSSEVSDLLAEPEPPEWVKEGLVMWDLQVAE